MEKIKVSIIGGSGYAGGELLRILLAHPNIEIKQVTARKYARFPVTVTHPNLRGFTKLKFSKIEQLEECDVLFVSLPNAKSQEFMPELMKKAKYIIDLGADYRLNTQAAFEKWYKQNHSTPEYIEQFIYGIAELHREEIKETNYISSAGCEATCSILSLYPLFRNKLVEVDRTIIDAKLGSSAAGGAASTSSHHPERAGAVRSYKPTGHRHTAEIEQELGIFGETVKVHVSATAIEMVRGILTTSHVFLKEEFKDMTQLDLIRVYNETYRDEPFVRIITDKMGLYRFPEPKILEGTNFIDIGLEKDKRSNRVVVVGAIDNLVKGTAGQAVQAMNLMLGFEETAGLMFSGLHPI